MTRSDRSFCGRTNSPARRAGGHDASPGGKAAAVAPPAYGIDFVDRTPGTPPIQAKWEDLNIGVLPHRAEKIRNTVRRDAGKAFAYLLWELDGFETQAQRFETISGPVRDRVHQAIYPTYVDWEFWSAQEIVERIENEIDQHQREEFDGGPDEVDEGDHGAWNATPAVERLADWSEVNPVHRAALAQAEDPDGNSVLYNLFRNLAEYHCGRANSPLPGNLPQLYQQWFNGGTFTRAQFKHLLGVQLQHGDNTNEIIQRAARTGNTFCLNGNYDAKSNKPFRYDNVIYRRDGGGNIDFAQHPSGVVGAYNGANATATVLPNAIRWRDPVDHASRVQMGTLTNAEYGLMPSGKKVELKKATRPQHFAIADSLYKNSRAGTLTWHHLTARYEMVLVDMAVHAKHGHNGGMHLWP